MADTLSSNFCSLCGFAFDRFSSEKQNMRTSLASPVVEESGLLERLNITVTPLRKELLFICYSCCTVFTNYTEAKTNFHYREQEALKLLTEPITEGKEQQGQLPFVPYLKRKYMSRPPSSPSSPASPSPAKVPKLVDNGVLGGNGKVKEEGIGKDGLGDDLECSEGVRRRAVELLEKGCYSSSLSELWGASREFRDGCLSFLSLLIMKETSDILQQDTLFTRTLNSTAFQEVSWGHTMKVLSSAAPATLCLLLALLGVDANNESKEAVEAQHSMVGCLLSMALYKRFRRRANFLPALHSLYLHTTHTPARVKRTLHQLGLTVPSFRLTALLKGLEAPSGDLANTWKRELERTLQVITRRPKNDEGTKKLPTERRKLGILPKPVAVTSYSLSWGSVECQGSQTVGSPRPSLSQAYAVRSRVPYMMTYRDEAVRQADNIPFEEFVPDSEDFIRVRNQMKKEVEKVLITHLGLFAGLSVTEEHQYSHYLDQKSVMVDLGTVFKSPGDSGSVATLMKNLKKYMVHDEGEPLSLCLFGEREGVELMVKAKDIMSCFSDKLDRLDGMEPCVADHGRQALLAKDIISIFFPAGLQDKNCFLRHLNIDKALIESCEALDFPSLQTLLQAMAQSYTLALAGRKMTNLILEEEKLSNEEKVNILEQLSEEIVSDVWPQVNTDSLDTVRQGNKVVRDRECSFGDCVNFREKARLPCSERCARPFYFCCQKPLNDGLVECARRENCPRGAWFHINKKCSGLVEAPEDDWLCGSCSALRRVEGLGGRTDGLWEYHRGFLWYCLFFLAGQTAERCGNGWLLHAIWKVSMPIFETQGHTDYLNLGYSFLSGVAGRISRLAAHDSLHNRTVNLTGTHNDNMSWDKTVQYISRETRGKTLQRRNTKEPGSPRRAEAYRLHSLTTAWESLHQMKENQASTSLPFIQSYALHLEALGVLQKVPGRQRVDDVEYTHVIRVRKPGVMVTTLRELCAKDVTRQMNEQETEVE
ncbi:LOW QUALITY PROTEIN: uncharacterized protein LOC123508500 [Portunus trituberculatus]|uniref:LOW QUALITY PROTEIN: uncharacterized protein LOC123508500 n=1 Tax=Portunus trituberculatus TaxID=210409 RepID=UPI001E1CC2D9|nr:LOW QUALITY PROTEIN: uncharacterized protein LOC123508500 [Portunus trituberculatus]